jgi:RNA polymerase sigma-70 factor (ECF subfamily)
MQMIIKKQIMTKEKFEVIYRKHYPEMYRLARTMLYDTEESKDAVSEVFVKLLRADIEPQEDKIEAYLMTSVRNKCRDVLSHKNVRERVEHLFQTEMMQNRMVTTNDDDRQERLNTWIDRELPPLSKQILKLRFLGEMSYDEVAKATGVERTTVYRHLTKSIESIREYFNATTKR